MQRIDAFRQALRPQGSDMPTPSPDPPKRLGLPSTRADSGLARCFGIGLEDVLKIQERNNKNNDDCIERKSDEYYEIEDVVSTPFHKADDRQTGNDRQRIWAATG